MSRIATLVTVLAVVAALFHSGPQQAWACTCFSPSGDETYARTMLESDLLVVGSVIDGPSGEFAEGEVSLKRVRVEQVFTGVTPALIEVSTPYANTCGLSGLRRGRRYVIAIDRDEAGKLIGKGCAILFVPIAIGPQTDLGRSTLDYLDTLKRISPSYEPDSRLAYSGSASDAVPPGWLVQTFIAASLVALTAIVVTARNGRVG